MIDFPCHCGHQFSVGEELAGSVMQCPDCRLLVDVPLLSDLQSIDDQGIYKLDASPNAEHDAHRVEELTQAFTRDHYDAEGEPIDLRQSFGKQSEILPPTIDPGAPKYDPVTGELIRPLDVKADPVIDPNSLPTARTARRLSYADTDAPTPLEFLAIPLRLLRPINLLVMFFILLGQALCQLMMVIILGGYWLMILFWPIMQCMMLAHFANVIDETGPTSHDELPTPLRHLSWHDDTFGPFFRVAQALLVCYGPAVLMLWYLHVKSVAPIVLPLSALLASVGTLLFPAALLTAVTSGSIVNLRPDRIIGVALLCGPEYIVAIFAWVFGGIAWITGTLALSAIALAAVSQSMLSLPPVVNMANSYAVTILAIFALHFLCWHLGSLYRRHHDRFPWLYQRHDHQHVAMPAKGFEVAPKRTAKRVRV